MALKNLLDWIRTDRFIIKPKTSLSSTEVEDGRVDIKNGILYTYDATRAKWITIQRNTLIFGRPGTTADQYLNFAGGGVSSKSGYRMIRNGCITGISVQTSIEKNFIIHIRKNDDETNIVSLTVSGFGKSETTTNVNISTDDYLQCYLEFTGTGFGVDDPIVMIEVAWRG